MAAFVYTMRLLRLSLQNFRNYVRLEEEMPAGVVLLVGGNAQGKTSFLEAIYYLATFASFHTRHDREMVYFDAPQWGVTAVGRIVAEFQREGEARARRLEVRLILEANGNGGRRLRREVLLDGAKKKLTEAMGVFNAVLFLPQMTDVITGAPELRRRYLDMALAQVHAGYARHLSEYNQALTRRNALLKQLNEQGGDVTQLDYWDERLAQHGAVLISARIQALRAWEKLARETHWALTRNTENLRLLYMPSCNPAATGRLPMDEEHQALAEMPVEQIEAGFRQALHHMRVEAIARGVTTLGPHRDDFRFLDGRLDLGKYGSRGQVRTAMLSLKMAEMRWMKQHTGFRPVLLLDEILAELDAARRADLQAHLADSEQVFLTTTDIDLFDADFVKRSVVWELEQGRILRS